MIGKKNHVLIIGEAGVNHNGDINIAKKLIDVAVESGIDIVKFQTYKTELVVTQDVHQAEYQIQNIGKNESQYEMLKKLELSYDDFRELKQYCDEKEIIFLSTADEQESALFLLELQNIFKIGSGEITNIPFLSFLGTLNKKILLSTGISTLSDIDIAIRTLTSAGTERDNITLLHVTTEYPTPMKDVNLNAMLTMRDAFKLNIGYSDHTMGIEVPIAAVALGASVIEKHFTLSKDMEGPDHKASIEPHELKEMVDAIRNIELALGNGLKEPQESELKNKNVIQKYIIASKPIQKDEILNENNLTVKRAKGHLPSSIWNTVLGTKAKKDFLVDEPIII